MTAEPVEGLPGSLPSRLRTSRMNAGLSQGQVAKLLEMHRPTISEIEAGNRRVTADELTRFSELYDVGVPWLLGQVPDRLEVDDPRLMLAARELGKLDPNQLDRLLNLIASVKTTDTDEKA